MPRSPVSELLATMPEQKIRPPAEWPRYGVAVFPAQIEAANRRKNDSPNGTPIYPTARASASA